MHLEDISHFGKCEHLCKSTDTAQLFNTVCGYNCAGSKQSHHIHLENYKQKEFSGKNVKRKDSPDQFVTNGETNPLLYFSFGEYLVNEKFSGLKQKAIGNRLPLPLIINTIQVQKINILYVCIALLSQALIFL